MTIREFLRNPILRKGLTISIIAIAIPLCFFVFSGVFFLSVEVSTEHPGEFTVFSNGGRTREEIGRYSLAGGRKEEQFQLVFFAWNRNDVELEFRGTGSCTIRRISFLHRNLIFRFEKVKRYLLQDRMQTENKTFELADGSPAILPLGIQVYSSKLNVPGVIGLWIFQILFCLRFFDLFGRIFKRTRDSFFRILHACTAVETERYTRFNSRFRIQEVLLLATMLPVVFLDIYTEKAWIVVMLVTLEIAAFVFSYFAAIERTKAGEKHPCRGLWQFALVALAVNLCLLEVSRLKYTELFCDESEKFMLACFLHKGYRLYDTVFCHHGPFTAILSHLVYLLHPANDIGVFRAPGFLVLLLPSILFLFTDIVPKRNMRITVSLLFPCSYLMICCLYSSLKGADYPCSIVLYQFYGAVFIGCALILLYPLLFHEHYNRKYLFWAGMFLSFSFFCAISYAISVFLVIMMAGIFFVCNFRQAVKKFSTLMFFVYGGIAGLLLVLAYLLAFGSIRGFIDQHILFNLQIYSKYIMSSQGFDGFGYYIRSILRILEQVLHGNVFYLTLLTVFVLLYPLSFSDRAGKLKRTILHFVFCVMIVLVALFSGRCSPFDFGFVPITQSGYVIMILAECALLSGLKSSRAWLMIAIGFLTLLNGKILQCRLPNHDLFLQLKQKEIPSSEIVQALTGPEAPVLFYPLGFSDYVGENRLPGGVSFPFMTSWTYEYGRDRLFAEIRETKPVMIVFYYSDSVWFQDDAMISEFLDFMSSEGYMQIHGTDCFILPEHCSRREELAQYELVPIVRQYENADPGIVHSFEEINRNKQYCSALVYPDKLKDRMVTGIVIRFATYSRSGSQLDGELEVRFLDERDETVEVFSMDCTDLTDNQPRVFFFESPCHPASIRISSTSSPQKGFTVWVDPDNQLSFRIIVDPVSQPRTIRRGAAPAPEKTETTPSAS